MYERASRTLEGTSAPKTFIRGQALLRTRKVVLSGAVFLAASVLGVASLGGAAAAAKAGGNTGNGTFTLDGSPLLARAKVGTYTLRCVTTAGNGGTFRLEDPDGVVLGDVVLPGTAGGSVSVSEQIKGTLTDGGTDFVVGDGFDITVSGAAKVNGLDAAKLATSTSTDGSQEPSLILAYDIDATASPTEAIVYESGDFVREQLIFGLGLTADSARETLRHRNITLG